METSPLKWSLIASSQAFSVFSGVLAAFMFAAIVLLLTRELDKYEKGKFKSTIAPDIAPPIAFMFGALFSLVTAAFLFAAMAGYSNASDLGQFLEGIMPSLALSLGVVQMAVGLAWLFEARGLGGTPHELARYVVGGTIVLAAFFLTGVAVSPWFQRFPLTSLLGVQLHPWLGVHEDVLGAVASWIGLAVIVIVSIPLGWIGRAQFARTIEKRPRHSRRPELPEQRARQRDQITRWVNVASIVLAVIAAVGWSVLSALRADSLTALYKSEGFQVALIIGALVVMAIFAAFEVAMPDTKTSPSAHV